MGFDLLTYVGSEIITRIVAERHVGALARKDFANCRTYATRSAGYERALSLKQQTHLAICLLKQNGDLV